MSDLSQSEASDNVLIRADSVLSEIYHRHGSQLPDDVRQDVGRAYTDCRRLEPIVRDVIAAWEAQAGTMRDGFPWLHEALSNLRRAMR